MFREVSGRPAVSGMSPGVRGMVLIIYGKWLEGSGKFRKGPEVSGLPEKSRMVGMTSGTHVASGPHGPTRAGRNLGRGEESLWDSNSPPPHTELGWEGVKLGLLPPKERWGRSPSWTPTPQGWPASLGHLYKGGRGRPKGTDKPTAHPSRAAAAPPTPCPSHHLHSPTARRCRRRTVYFIYDAGALLGRLPRHRQRPCGVPDLHRHVPASTVCLITPRRGDALPVRVDTVEALYFRRLIVGTNTSPRD